MDSQVLPGWIVTFEKRHQGTLARNESAGEALKGVAKPTVQRQKADRPVAARTVALPREVEAIGMSLPRADLRVRCISVRPPYDRMNVDILRSTASARVPPSGQAHRSCTGAKPYPGRPRSCCSGSRRTRPSSAEGDPRSAVLGRANLNLIDAELAQLLAFSFRSFIGSGRTTSGGARASPSGRTSRRRSRISGHRQPRVPRGGRYYNLLDPSTQDWQAELARSHGLGGFCYYHYWFGGIAQLLAESVQRDPPTRCARLPVLPSVGQRTMDTDVGRRRQERPDAAGLRRQSGVGAALQVSGERVSRPALHPCRRLPDAADLPDRSIRGVLRDAGLLAEPGGAQRLRRAAHREHADLLWRRCPAAVRCPAGIRALLHTEPVALSPPGLREDRQHGEPVVLASLWTSPVRAEESRLSDDLARDCEPSSLAGHYPGAFVDWDNSRAQEASRSAW